MRIVYVARHRPGDWDEGAGISYVLEKFGHQVVRIQEGEPLYRLKGDMLLYHHYGDLSMLEHCRIRPKVFWYFDLVDFPDPILAARCNARKHWIEWATNASDLGFMNDGDWVAKDVTGKLHTLREGVDERFIGKGEVWGSVKRIPYRHALVDGATGAAVFYGVLTNSPTRDQEKWWFYTVRLKVEKRQITEIEEIAYDGMNARKVSPKGLLKWAGEVFFLSSALQGWSVGIEVLNARRSNVWFGRLLLGQMDLESRSFERTTLCAGREETTR